MADEAEETVVPGGLFDGMEAPAGGDPGGGADPAANPNAALGGDPEGAGPEAGYEHEFLKTYQGGKYRTVEDMSKAHASAQTAIQDLKGKLGGFNGAPADEAGNFLGYDLTLPEGWEGEIDAAGPEMESFKEWGKRHNMSGEAAQDAFENVYLPLIAGVQSALKEDNANALTALYGSAEVANEQTRGAFEWAAGLLRNSPDAIEQLREAGSNYLIVPVLHSLREAIQSNRLGRGDAGGAKSADARYQELLSDPRTAYDPALSAELTQLANARAGTS